jgi:BED zinc finger.
MEEQVEETLSEKTLSGEEFIPDDICEYEDDGDEWESVSQISGTSTSTDLSGSGSSVWIYFDKNPAHAPGFSVCKNCSKKYKLTTSVTSLRKHLQTHQLNAPTRTEKSVKKYNDPFSKREQKEHDKYLVQWLIRDLQPFTVVDNLSFRAFVNFLCSRYVIPDRHKAKGKIDLFFYNTVISVISNLLFI